MLFHFYVFTIFKIIFSPNMAIVVEYQHIVVAVDIAVVGDNNILYYIRYNIHLHNNHYNVHVHDDDDDGDGDTYDIKNII